MNLIVAIDKNYGIGYKGELLVSIEEDLKNFKEKTIDKVVVMGRNTKESLPNGKPLKNRVNIVLTKDKNYSAEGFIVLNSKKQLFEKIKKYNSDDIFFIGGESIYNEFQKNCKYAYVTKIENCYNSDKKFFCIDNDENWIQIEKGKSKVSDKCKAVFSFNLYKNRNVENI
ncbi:dihydrofolate reductase [Clostridium ihumii]|uniref:dihydrofolate reductase n=2 Tax=Clostridium ihumii TaxID=1470356 RepID=UPI003D329A50